MMSTIVEPSTSTPPPRRHRGKKHQVQNPITSTHDENNKVSHTPKTKRLNSHAEAQSRITSDTQDDLVSPLTPPHPAIDKVQQPSQKVPGSTSTKKKGGRGRKGIHTTSPGFKPILPNPIQPVGARKESPGLAQSQSTPPPLKQATQMYAGPTFHASPAPSTLPIPRFFSRPEMSEDKIVSSDYTSPEETSSQDSTSAKGDQSPSLRSPMALGKAQAREPSPLDIFFKADREEKARLAQNSPQRTSLALDRAKSASPSIDSFKESESQSRQHSRRQTESQYPLSGFAHEDNRAKTAALKQLLLIPTADQSPSALPIQLGSPSFKTPNQSYERAQASASAPSLVFSSQRPVRSESSLLDSPDIPLDNRYTQQPRRPLPYHIRQDLINKLPLN